MRLDIYLATYWPETSRSQWQKYIEAGYVSVNGNIETSVKLLLGEDDEVVLKVPEAPDYSHDELPVIYQDDNVIVIDKPAGILTHAKGEPLDEFTVGEFMRSRTTDKPDGNRPGIVHRLDRATSGVIICARSPEVHSYLQRQFSDRNVKKHYVAVTSKVPEQHEAIIDVPIERDPAQPSRFRVGAGGKAALTRYKVRKVINDDRCVIDLYPTTGRTHQLRVHMAYIKAPIIGDQVYGTTDSAERMMLHAASLEITIPGGIRKTFESPLPAGFDD